MVYATRHYLRLELRNAQPNIIHVSFAPSYYLCERLMTTPMLFQNRFCTRYEYEARARCEYFLRRYTVLAPYAMWFDTVPLSYANSDFS